VIKDIAYVYYPAKDVTARRKFYADTLGFNFGGIYAEEGVEKYAEAPVGSGWFSVMTDEWADVRPGSGVSFEVDDIEKTVADLRSKGVATEDIHETPVCKLGSFTDPEGNKVTLHQTTVPH
jgi:predicted enzyme related to lactoylglutathione lyase